MSLEPSLLPSSTKMTSNEPPVTSASTGTSRSISAWSVSCSLNTGTTTDAMGVTTFSRGDGTGSGTWQPALTSAQSGRRARDTFAGSGAGGRAALAEQPRSRPLDVDQGLLAQACDLCRVVRRKIGGDGGGVAMVHPPGGHPGPRPPPSRAPA